MIADGAKILKYFSDFSRYNAYVSGLLKSEHRNLFKHYVAAAVFVASAAVLFYLIVMGIEPNLTSFGVLASLVASGGYMFFDAWISGEKAVAYKS